jgi:hypothetical protein
MDSPKFHLGSPCPTLAMPYPSTSCGQDTHETALWPFQGGSCGGWAACSLLPHWTPHAVRLCTHATQWIVTSAFVGGGQDEHVRRTRREERNHRLEILLVRLIFVEFLSFRVSQASSKIKHLQVSQASSKLDKFSALHRYDAVTTPLRRRYDAVTTPLRRRYVLDVIIKKTQKR